MPTGRLARSSPVSPGGYPGDRIDKQLISEAEALPPTELPALAFCLLFRFQGAEALRTSGVDDSTGSVPGSSGGSNSLRRAESNTTHPGRRPQPVVRKNLDEVVRLAPVLQQQVSAVEQGDVAEPGHSRRLPHRWREIRSHRACDAHHLSTIPNRCSRAARPDRRARRRDRRDDGHLSGHRRQCRLRRRGRVAPEQHVGRPVGRRAASAPCTSSVISRPALAGRSDVGAPRRARRSVAWTSSSGRVENRSRYSTIASSSAWIQNWRNWYGEVRSGSSQTAPPSVLPNLVPSLLAATARSGRARRRRPSCGSGRCRR